MSAPRRFSDDELIAAIKAHGTQRAAAKALGVGQSAVQQRMARLPVKGYSPPHDMTHPVPDGFRVKGVSTAYKPDGTIALQWVKSTEDAERQRELMLAACEAMTADLPQVRPRMAGRGHLSHLLTGYPIGDPHIGMRAWAEECGDDWDLSIAERVHCSAMEAW